jgi:hypothetical protein
MSQRRTHSGPDILFRGQLAKLGFRLQVGHVVGVPPARRTGIFPRQNENLRLLPEWWRLPIV